MVKKFVTVIVPCLNEERFIEKCLDSIIANDYPKDSLEILVVDGGSKDRTREIIEEYRIRHTEDNMRLLDNPKTVIPAAMNVGITNSKGEVIIKMDAHCVYAKDYISKCAQHLEESGADNVGGVLKNRPAVPTNMAKAIALCLSHPFGAGGSSFRTGVKKPREAETAAFGCFYKTVFERIGLYNENMEQTEDLELNYRLRTAGGRIMVFPDIVAWYYPSSTNLKDFFSHNIEDGVWATYPLRYGLKLSVKHFMPLVFVVAFPVAVWLYIPVLLWFSVRVAAEEKNPALFIALLAVFPARHIGYGLGSLIGLFKAFTK